MQDAVRVQVQHGACDVVRQAHGHAQVGGAGGGVAQQASVQRTAQRALYSACCGIEVRCRCALWQGVKPMCTAFVACHRPCTQYP